MLWINFNQWVKYDKYVNDIYFNYAESNITHMTLSEMFVLVQFKNIAVNFLQWIL